MNDQDQFDEQALAVAKWTVEHIREVWENKIVAAAYQFELTLEQGMCAAEVMVLAPDLAHKVKKFIQKELSSSSKHEIDNPVK